MAQQPQLDYRSAVYHVMARGNGGDHVFAADDVRKSLLFRLGQACANHGEKGDAWVLVGNHFHLLLETPQTNLVTGMPQWFATFSHGWDLGKETSKDKHSQDAGTSAGETWPQLPPNKKTP